MQYPLAERVDGLDFEASGCFKGRSKQAARPRPKPGINAFAANACEALRQCPVINADPFPQPLVQAVGHFRGGSLGVSEAKNGRRVHPLKHEPDNPVDQHMGFSRSGIGADPGGSFGI